MKRLLVAVLFVSVFCVPVIAKKKSAPDFNRIIKEYYAAWSTLNPDNPAPAYAKDADLVFFDVDPVKYTSRTITPNDDIKITRSGNLAVASLTFRLVAKAKDGSPMEFTGRHTIVFQNRAGKWLI